MKKILGLVMSLTVISAVCAAVLAFVNSITEEPIRGIRVKQEQSAVKAVLPQGTEKIEQKHGVFFGFDAAGGTVGYAAKGRDAGGYGGDIELMVGFQADGATVVGYKTLAAAETPGLGMKLNSPEFFGQFAGKSGAKISVKQDGGEIEAITSATITSRAVCRAIADAAVKVAAAKIALAVR